LAHRRGNLLTSFNYAFDGIVHALRYERNMWIHFGIAALVLIAGLFFALTRVEVIALLVAISFVLITEMFNTAIEHVVDLVTDEDDPRARAAGLRAVRLPVLEREAEHVGDLVLAPVLAVEVADAALAHERHRDLGAMHTLLVEHPGDEARDELVVDRGARPVDDLDDVHDPVPSRNGPGGVLRCARAAPISSSCAL
jgi:diacylglycerol kinase